MAVPGLSSRLPWPFWGLMVTLVVGLLLGAHQREAFAEFSLAFNYGYWVVRLLMAYLMFAGCLLLLEIAPLASRLAWGWLALASALVTLPFFTLSVTMLDMLLGLPELGLQGFGVDSGNAELYSATGMSGRFVLESLYHLDNHLALCALIVLPRLLLPAPAVAVEEPAVKSPETSRPPGRASIASSAPAFLQRFDPPLQGPVLAVQAQEHYVRVITAEGALCTLYRFSDALREMERFSGLQVHRSFWVADDGVAAIKAGKRGMKIVLRNGEEVPVSARHADVVQRRYNARLKPVA